MEMTSNYNSIPLDLRQVSKLYGAYKSFYPKKDVSYIYQFDQSLSNVQNLSNLAVQLLDDKATSAIFYTYRQLIIELATRLINNEELERHYLFTNSLKTLIPGTTILNALAKITTISNEISILVEYFLDQKQFFNSLNNCINSIKQDELQFLLLAFYRLITTNRQRFLRFINPNLLYTILSSQATDINKYLSIQILSSYLFLSEEVRNDMISNNVSTDSLYGYYESDLNINYLHLPILEAKRLSNFTKLPLFERSIDYTLKYVVTLIQSDLSKGVSVIAGVLVPNLTALTSMDLQAPPISDFVPIKKSLAILQSVASSVQKSSSIMLVGKAGTGKTFIINELANFLHMDSNSIVKIHLNQQTDSKLLLGTYTSGATPGSFEWKNGVLTTAVKEGRWVLVEDIDKAPNEVLSILLSLLENKELTIPSRGEVIKAANGFQLISTIRTAADTPKHQIPDMIGLRLWDIIELEELESSELRNILDSKFPLLSRFNKLFINCFLKVKDIYNSRKFVSMNKGAQVRPISIRDLMKFCNRCIQILSNAGIKSSDDLIQDEVFDSVFQEAVDCFTSSIVEIGPIQTLVKEIGETLEVPTSRINLQLTRNVPVFEETEDSILVGRARLNKQFATGLKQSKRVAPGNNTSFARTNHSLKLMEKVGVAVSMTEPLLLVGETGTGKTTVVQEMAKLLNKKLTVINVSQQTEVGDLLGGFKPVNAKTIALPIQEDFEDLFNRSFSVKKNAQFLKLLAKCFNKSQWKNVSRLWREAYKMAQTTYAKPELKNPSATEEESTKKKRKLNDTEKSQLMREWAIMFNRVTEFEKQSISIENSFLFKFIEGSLVKAVRNGDWLLLDEMNLATPETLDSISDLLSDHPSNRNILLSEKGDAESIKAHPNFRIFGCMNPSTDVGKKDLPAGIRSRFSEIYVHSPDQDITDLLMIIDKYIGKYSITDEWVGNDIAELYLKAKELSDTNAIVDGANQKPHFSIRTLTRTLLYVRDIVSIYGLRRSLYEAFCMSFLTLLDAKSEGLLEPEIHKYTIGRLKNAKSVVKQIPPNPSDSSDPDEYTRFEHYWMKSGPGKRLEDTNYIMTASVKKNLLNLVRATSGRRFPVLIQGPTSAGKTSMINYLAKLTGHEFVRINNHEHTDLQEYLGTYVSDDTGKLAFKEGVLVEALRKGHWIVLDELNLAPTDVLEALNRLLDDNRELFIPETQEVIRPHPEFMLFATQNPPGLYGGRKVLSKAFRNRFLELHFDDIPPNELEEILARRCKIAPTYAKKVIEVYKELSIQRQSTRLFEQKNSFATLRDLFRWAQRDAIGYEQLAANGYMLLAERVRRSEEKVIVKQVIEKVMRVQLDMDTYYKSLEIPELLEMPGNVIWTKAMRRLAVLVTTSMKHNEPLLLVGETGCGKTTVCQLISEFFKKELIIVNAHQNTETGDLLGAQRPIRNRSELQSKLKESISKALGDIGVELPGEASLDDLILLWKTHRENEQLLDENKSHIERLLAESTALFEWCDGPLISAMKSGSYFLLDEISLADDSVLERLNSVLEPERSLLLAEKGTDNSFITASENFQFLATMNPGGDYGKKELSPALRNRFTEIWVPSMEDFEDVRQIVNSRLDARVKDLTDSVVKFSEWYALRLGGGSTSNGVISLRDILAWVLFINSAFNNGVPKETALLHGASMVFIDALGTNNTAHLAENETKLRDMKLEFVFHLSQFSGFDLTSLYLAKYDVLVSDNYLSCGSFKIQRTETALDKSFNLQAPTTASNTMRVIRAMQVSKPILLEGSPGVGKTSLIAALSKASGNTLTRINLSEQTDLIDLFGSDSPAEGGEAGQFVWRDAPFLRAMQRGEWVLLDEMNLASQSVLEGLNACLDHRGEAYIPELDRSFTSHPNFKVFAAQNPQYQGGGRKGLPKSFVNRFSVVYVDMLTEEDLRLIAHHLYPNLDSSISNKMISFMSELESQVVVKRQWGSSGGPWEFNLRDTLRWLSLLDARSLSDKISPSDFFNLVVKQRFRTTEDRAKSEELFESIFGKIDFKDQLYQIGSNYVQANGEISMRNTNIQYLANHSLVSLECNSEALETLLRCVNHSWPMILVGPSNSGKTELIRYAASVVGSKVYEFSMNSDIDSMDILGGYEQADISRELAEFSSTSLEFFLQLIAVNLRNNTFTNSDVLRKCLAIVSFLNSVQISTANISDLKKHFEVLMSSCNNEGLSPLYNDLNSLISKASEKTSVKFQWFDGLLVQAVEKGHWLILDNANLCSPSVLDRLNSLLEIDGTLVVNECTNEDGSPRLIKPHPNFRLFLTSDPKYGELSRAMRNRGVEIYLHDLKDRSTVFDKRTLGYPLESKKETNIDEELSKLDLSSSSLGRSVSSFVSCYDSSASYPSLILDSFDLTSSDYYKELVALLSVCSPIASVPAFKKFSETVSTSSEFSDSLSELFVKLASKLQFFEDNGIVKSITSLYSPLTNKSLVSGIYDSYSTNQLLMPLLNVYIIDSLSQDRKYLNSDEAHYFTQVIGLFSDSSDKLNSLVKRSQSAKPTDLNYLERSAAASFGRDIKKVPRLKVFDLVCCIFTFVKDEIISVVKKDYLLADDAYFKSLFDLLLLWNNLFDSSSSQNESKLRVYQDQLLHWIDSFQFKNSSTNFDILTSSVAAFSKDFKLSKGSAMALIWENSRATYPSSDKAWSNFEQLYSVAEEFDKLSLHQFPESVHQINTLRRAFLSLFESCLDSTQPEEFENLVENLQSQIMKLEQISSKFLNTRSHLIMNEFKLLLNFIDSSASGNGTISINDEILTLSLLAGRSTFSLLKAKQSHSFKPYPRILDALWISNENDYVTNTSQLFSDDLFKRINTISSEMTNVPGGKIEELLSDVKLFSSSLVSHSTSLLDDQLSLFKSLVLQWVAYICSLHENSVSANQLEELQSFIDSLETETYDQDSLASFSQLLENSFLISFNEVFLKYFCPGLLSLKEPISKLSVGRAWTIIGCGFIQLYVPSSAYDPAITDHVMYESFLGLQQLIENTRKSWFTIRTVMSGDKELHAEELLPIIEESKIPSKPRVFRSGESTDSLFDEWSSFMDSSINDKQIETLLDAASNFTKKASSQIENFERNSSQFVLRLKDGFSRYADLNEILIGYIYCVKLGFELMFTSTKESCSSKFSSLWPVDITTLTNFTEFSNICSELKGVFKSVPVTSFEVEEVYSFIIKFANLAYNHGDLSHEINDLSSETLLSLYYRWSLRRLKQEEAESVQQGVFKFSDPAVDAEKDFQKMFPDSEDVIDATIDEGKSPASNDDVYYEIAKTYILSYGKSTSLDSSFANLLSEGSSIVQFLNKLTATSGYGKNSASKLVTLVTSLSISIQQFTMSTDSKDIDFYNGYNSYETNRAGDVIRKLQGSVHELLKQWPEHATLGQLFRICQEFLDFSSQTPIFRLLAKVEQIYTFVSEWEKYAHSGVSLKVHGDSLANLIVSWRKLELVSWKQVFKNEELTVQKNMGKWWFHLFESIIIPATQGELESDENEVRVIAAVNVFLSQTTYGEFGYRLELLKAFVNHVHILVPESAIYDSLCNVICFYEQFQGIIDDGIITIKKKLEKDVNEVILLASWKDVNVDALKQSSRRSHHNLYKVIRKYRDVLNQSITQIIEAGLDPSKKTLILKQELPIHNVIIDHSVEEILSVCSQISSWKERSGKLPNSQIVGKNMTVYIQRVDKEELPNLYEYTSEVAEQTERLRKETPGQLKEDNKKLCANLKSQKLKLFSDILRDLKEMGLRLHSTSDVQKALSSVTAIIATSKTLSGLNVANIDGYYFKMLDLLPRLRAAVNEVNEEIPPALVQKGLAAAENLMVSLIAGRETLCDVSNLSQSVSNFVSEFSSLENKNAPVKVTESDSTRSVLKQAKKVQSWLPEVINVALNSLKASSEFTKNEYSTTIFDEARLFVKGLIIPTDRVVLLESDIKLVDSVDIFMLKFINELNNWKSCNTPVAFIADFVLDWIASQNFKFTIESSTSLTKLNTIEDVELVFRQLMTYIILSVQKISSSQKETGVITADDKNWLVNSQSKLTKYSKLLYPGSLSSKFESCILMLNSVEYNESTSKQVQALVSYSMPIIKHYQNLVNTVLLKLRDNYINVSHGAYNLSYILYKVSKDGFCSPQPPQESKEDDNLHEGTGLGDGEGATNNSNDVEDDEDLSEQAQQPNEENKDKDEGEEENDDAVDIEGDMAGDLENAPPEDDDEGKEGEDDKDEEELDDEVDDLDDMDPNAIDEKMWDEEATDNSKEKDSENMPEDSNANDDMQGVDDDDDKTQDNKDNSQDDQNKEPEESNEGEDKDDEEGDEDNVGQQDDEVRNEEDQQLDAEVPEAEVLDLPEDINLDEDNEGSEAEEKEGDDDGFEDKLDDQDQQMDPADADKMDADMTDEPVEDENENEEEVEGESNDKEEEGEDKEEEEEEGDENFGNDDAELNEEGGVENEEDLMDVDEEQKGEDSKIDEENNDNIEGLDGAEDGNNNDKDIDADTAAQQKTGMESEGADAEIQVEQENIGASGGSADFQNDAEKNQDEEKEQTDSSRDLASESLKQLGDSLKEFHRRRQEIKEATDDDMVEQKSGERPDEFQHLEGENTNSDTQALGAANQDQIQSINDEMAIDDDQDENGIEEEKNEKSPTIPEDENSVDKDEDELQEAHEAQDDFNGQSKTAMVGERKRVIDDEDFDMKMEIDDEDDSESENFNDEDIHHNSTESEVAELRPYEESQELWKKADESTRELTAGLCEQLRLILEPTLATKLKGDYKTGKRLNMKRIIPYIASSFRKDKIWMRRTKPSKRQYQIMVAVDDSKSMAESKSVEIAFQSITLVSKALTQLESGQLSIVKFGENTEVVHPFEKQFSSESGVRVFQSFKFDQVKTDIHRLVNKSIKIFNDARSMGDSDLWQLQIILSDGVCEKHEDIQKLVRRAREEKIMLVFVVIDGVNNNQSILDMTQVEFIDGKMEFNRYLDSFPFEFYVVVHNINELPEMLSLILRQYFSELASV